ncbi:D-aminoacid aminotransferase-like PLP-dependent enzyme [Xylona heveae TC161]|uniref:D-aminoacid aminotransferase-like PLP-dependent enzyme n=1 Tax=Xylona heveae (strain CBS 132557 / TC161) TaxID=1328760 RepID=A0A165JGF7_XYLHT|nr:D-aminoacid aminotransferase-like PLP-dependent enzyme [Xylona heveae TC161]KZF26203.1 D-aminoacid aminotransferase-like PLP-dependent enzyme [Xylona heveae TC161]
MVASQSNHDNTPQAKEHATGNNHGNTHAVVPNEKNANILIGMRDGVTGEFALFPRQEAKISVFDSNFLVGDGIWEGIRSYNGRIQFAREHINRLFQSAKAMYMDLGISKAGLLDLIHDTIDANGMQDSKDVHIRLVVSRGLKSTPYQNPSVNIGLPLIVIIPEYKKADPASKARGLRLITSHIRRGPPDVKDEMWNHISKATDIQACIGANVVGADEALMLDPHGFVKTCNSVNLFIVRDGEVWSPTRAYQMQGITRAKTISLCRANNIPIVETDFTLTETYGADEVFCTGTFPSHIPALEVDGRIIGEGKQGPITTKLQQLYSELVKWDVGRSREEIRKELQ